MAWIRLDDAALTHPKFLHAASRITPHGHARVTYWWLALVTYAAKYQTDGAIPASLIVQSNSAADAPENPVQVPRGIVDIFVDVGLVDRAEDGALTLHDYTEYQPTSAQIATAKKAARDRQSRSRKARPKRDRAVENTRKRRF